MMRIWPLSGVLFNTVSLFWPADSPLEADAMRNIVVLNVIPILIACLFLHHHGRLSK